MLSDETLLLLLFQYFDTETRFTLREADQKTRYNCEMDNRCRWNMPE